MNKTIKERCAKAFLVLFMTGVTLVCWAIPILWGVANVLHEIDIWKSRDAYIVADGTIEYVWMRETREEWHGCGIPDFIPEKTYWAEISYTDLEGNQCTLISSERDKKLKVGKDVKVVYDPTMEKEGDLAYFDLLVFKYMPCYKYNFSLIGTIGIFLVLLLAFTFTDVLVKVFHEDVDKPEKAKKTKKKKKKWKKKKGKK